MRITLGLCAAVLVALVVWWQPSAELAATEVRTDIETYQVTTDPDEMVMTMRVSGGMAMGNDLTYRLFGDGRLELEDKRAEGIQTKELSFIEMEDLVGTAVTGNLIGLDWETLETQILKEYPGVATLTDIPRMKLEVFLTSVQDSEGQDMGGISSTFSCVCSPAYLALKHEKIPAVQALHSLTRALQAPFFEGGVQNEASEVSGMPQPEIFSPVPS